MGKRKFTVEEYLQIFDLYEAGYSFETIIEMKSWIFLILRCITIIIGMLSMVLKA